MKEVGTFMYKGNRCSLFKGRYRNNRRIALQVYDDTGPLATLSVNISEADIKEDEFVLNHDVTQDLITAVTDAFQGIGETDRTVSYGYVKNQPVYYFVE